MSESYLELSAGFSTADAERLSIEHHNSELIVRFSDWRETPVTIHFPSTVAYRWQVEAVLPQSIRDDQSYEVIDSHWRAELAGLGIVQPGHRHYKLCFNAVGILDVISHTLQVLS